MQPSTPPDGVHGVGRNEQRHALVLDDDRDKQVDVRIIDFAHVSRVGLGGDNAEPAADVPVDGTLAACLGDTGEACRGSDPGFALGIASIIACLERLEQSESGECCSPLVVGAGRSPAGRN